MTRTIRSPIVVVLSVALALSAVAPAGALAQEGTSPACDAAFAALARYYEGEITKAEADAAVALCEAESQDPPGNGQGGGGPGGGGQGQVPQPQDGNGQGGGGPGGGGQGQGSNHDPWAQGPTPVTGDEWHRAYDENEQFCGNAWRPRETNEMFVGTDTRYPGQRLTWRCAGSYFELISTTFAQIDRSRPPQHYSEQWAEALIAAGLLTADICRSRLSFTINSTQTLQWSNDGVARTFPFISSNPQWIGLTVWVDNPSADSAACAVRTRMENREAALQAARDRNLAEWPTNPPAAYCEDRTFIPPVPNPDGRENDKRTRYYVVRISPDLTTGDWVTETLVNHSGIAQRADGGAIGNVWSSDVYFDRAKVIEEMNKFDCSLADHNAIITAYQNLP